MALERAMDEQGLVLLKETDLEAIPQYLATKMPARLYVTVDDQTADFEVDVGLLKTGEYIMPWRADSITDVMTNGLTYLYYGGVKIFFSSARELFYGENKTFIVCTKGSSEP